METTAYEESKLTRAIVEAVRKKNWTEACQLIPRINSTKIFRLRAHEYLHWPFQDSMNDESAVLRDLCSRGLWEPIGEMLGQGLPPEQQSFVIQQAVNRADCATFIRFIFPHCPGEERIRVLAESLNRMSETEFQRYVSLPELSDGDLSNFMFGDSPSTLSNQMSESETLEHQLHASEPFNEVMSDFMLGDSPSTLSNRASETELDLHVLAEISDDEISKVMDYSVRRGMWKAVGVLLNKGVPDDQRLWAVGEARRRADEHEYFRYVSAYCDGDLDTELTQLVTLGYWKAVGKVLQRAGQTVSGTVSDSKRRWAVEVASTKCDERSFVSLILPYCFDDQLESIAKLSVLRGHWEVVGQVLKKGVSDLIRAWIIKEAVIYADAESFVNYILPYCSGVTTVNVARFLAELTGGCKWSALGKLLRSGVSNVQLKWVAREICVKVHNTEENLFELDMRSDKTIAEPLLTEMKNYGDRFLECLAVELLLLHSWSTIDFEVAKFLIQMNINLPLQLCIIEKASTETFVTSICSPKLKECTLEQLVSRRLFVAAKQVLDSGVSDICRKEAAPMVLTAFMEMILTRDIPTEFFDVLLSVCNTEQMSHVVKLTVRNGLWDVLCTLLESGIGEETRELAMQEVYKYASCETAALYLSAFLKKEYLEEILVPLVAHECWYLVDKVLQQSVCEARQRFAIKRASILASSADFHDYILPHLNDNEVEVVLPHLVRRKCWFVVSRLLERPLDSAMYKLVVEEANKHASANEYLLCIRQRPGEVDIDRALSELMDKFDENVNRVKGSYVRAYLPLTDLTKLLEFGPSHALRLRFFEWASMCARDDEYATHIIPHFCAQDSLDGIFTNLVKGCKWISAGKMLEQTANEMLCKQAIYQYLCKFRSEGEDFDFAQNILPYIPDSMHEDITSLFMTEKKWIAVIQMLHKGKDGPVYDQAVLACKANCSFFMDYCLPHCTERQLGVVLQEMCQQGKWSEAAHLLSLVALKLDTVRHSLFIQKVFEHKSKEITPFPKWETLLSRCPSETLQLVLPTAINQCMWKTVLFILKQDVSLSARDSAISQASHYVSDVQFATDFLPLISKHDPEEENVKLIEGVIPKLIERRMWRSLGVIFQNDQVKEGSYNLVIQKSWDVAKTQTSNQGRERPPEPIYYNDLDIYICNVMPFCNEHQITRMLSDCIEFGAWKVFGKILQREVDETLKRKCVRQACHIAGEQAIIRHILPYSRDDDIEDLVRILASRKFWQAAFKLQQRKIDLPKVAVDVVALCKDAGKCVSVAGVLKLCTDDQVEALVGMFMSEGRWELVGTVLRYGVNETIHRHIVEQALLQLDRNSVDFLCYILPHSKEELDDTFVHLVESHYASVRKIMQYGVSERKLLWAAKREMTGLTNLPEVFVYLRDEYIELICKDYLHELETGKAGTITPSAVSGVLKYTESDETLGEAIKIAIKSDRGFNEMSNIDMKYHIQKYLQRCSDQHAESILNLLLEKGLLEYATTAKDGYLNETWCRKAIVKASETEQERILLHLTHYNLTDDEIDNFAKIHIRMLKKSRALDSASMKFILRVFDRCTAPTKLLIAETVTVLHHHKFNGFILCYKLEDTDFLRQEYAKMMVYGIRECLSRGEFVHELQICTSEDVWNMLNPQEMLQLLKQQWCAQHFVSRCSRARFLELIQKLVLEKRWKVLQQLLFQRGLDEMTTKTIVKKACEQASEDELFKSGEASHGILCFCADDQVETALRILIDRNMSTAVGYLLQRNAGCVQNIVGLKPVLDNLDNEKYKQFILPFAEALFDCDTLVTDLVSRGLWDRLTPCMMKEVSDDTRQSVIEQACELASDEHLQHVLFCTEVDLDQILEKLTEKEMWKSIYHMWVHGRIRGESWFSDLVYIEACKHLDENEVCTCLRSCPDQLVDVVLDVVLSRGLWKAATTVLARHFSEDRRDTIVIEVCRSADQKTVSSFIQSFFSVTSASTERLDAMLDVLVSRCMWTEAERLAYQGVSAEKRRWAVIKACQSEKDDDAAADFIAHHCDAKILHETLAQLVVADHWKAVAELMDSDLFISMRNRSGVWRMHTEQTEYGSNVEENDENCLNDFTLTWIYRRACKYADEDAFRKMSWQLHISFEGKYTVFSLFMKHLVRRRLWRAVDVIFKRTMSDVDYLCLQTGRGPYRETAIQFDRGHTSQQSRFTEHLEVFIWAADEAGRLATEEELTKYIIPHCATVQLETILEHLIRRRLWKGIGTILETSKNSKRVNYTNREMTSKIQRVTKSLQIRAVEEASKGAEEEILCILPYCTCSQFDTALGHSTEREHWRAVGKLLQLTHDNPNTEGSGTVEITPNCVMAVQESSMLARDGVFSKHILPFCTGKRLQVLVSCVSPQPADSSPTEESSKDVVFEGIAEPSPLNVPENAPLANLIKRKMWSSLEDLLNLRQQLPEVYRKYILEETSKQLHYTEVLEFNKYILKNCLDSELHFILRPFVNKGMWSVVKEVLQRDLHDSLLRWTLTESSKHADDKTFQHSILPHCPAELYDVILPNLLSRGLLGSVSMIYQQGATPAQQEQIIRGSCPHADDSEGTFAQISSLCTDDSSFQTMMVCLYENRQQLTTVSLLCTVIRESICKWAMTSQGLYSDNRLWALLKYYHTDTSWAKSLLGVFRIANRRGCVQDLSELHKVVGWSMEVRSLVFTVVLTCICRIISKDLTCHDEVKRMDEVGESTSGHIAGQSPRGDAAHRVFDYWCSWIGQSIQDHEGKSQNISNTFEQSTSDLLTKVRGVVDSPFSLLELFRDGLSVYQGRRTSEEFDMAFVELVTVVPVSDELQDIAIRHMLLFKEVSESFYSYAYSATDKTIEQRKWMLDQRRWRTMKRATEMPLWEHTRRLLFHAAVREKKWKVVRQWTDYSVCDDQRLWALKEAYKDKQWKVMLLLADHGLTLAERMRVHNRLAKYADWDTARRIFERGADVSEMRDMLQNTRKKTRKHCVHDFDIKKNRDASLLRIEESFDRRRKYGTYQLAAEYKWSYMLYCFHRYGSEGNFMKCLKTAVKRKAWHVVVHLVRDCLNTEENDKLFQDMLTQEQWDVCRVCLETGVSLQVCLDALDQLIEASQWTLVAVIVWSYDLGYDTRQKIMRIAMERREGSVVRHCIQALKTSLSVRDREKLFEYAFQRDIWQALKSLVEYKDSTGIGHRDKAFLEAIEQHVWDVVDHCQLHHADINMKDKNGETPLHRAARAEDWQAVEEIVSRDGDPNLLDKDGVSVLNQAVASWSWSTVKVLIEYLANIHQPAKSSPFSEDISPLERLVERCRGSEIEHSLMWCPDQWKGVTVNGETALHAVCRSGWPNTMRYLIARKVDPMAVTKNGYSVLSYALMNVNDYRKSQKMLGECISLGLGTHQPGLSQAWEDRYLQARRMEVFSEDIINILQQFEKQLVSGRNDLERLEREDSKRPHYDSNERIREIEILFEKLDRVLQKVQHELRLLRSKERPKATDSKKMRSYFIRQFKRFSEVLSSSRYVPYWYPGILQNVEQMKESKRSELRQAYQNAVARVPEDALLHALIEGDLQESHLDIDTVSLQTIFRKIILTKMLYESGALSYTNLQSLHDMLSAFLENVIEFPETNRESLIVRCSFYKDTREKVETFLSLLTLVEEMSRTPRTLIALCRLKISHCLDVRGRRERDIEQLPFPRGIKKYLMFSDLTDPKFGKGVRLPLSEENQEWMECLLEMLKQD